MIQHQLPPFTKLYREMFGHCYSGKYAMKTMIDKQVRPLFEKFVSSARHQVGHTDVFKLPGMTELDPAVWEQMERIITGNPKWTKCRNKL